MSGLEAEFEGRLRARNLDATTPEAVETIQRLGFVNHGLVIRSPQGEVLWKQADHQVNLDDVRAALERLLKQ